MLIHLSITYMLVDRMDLFACSFIHYIFASGYDGFVCSFSLSLTCFPYLSYLFMDVYMLYGCLYALWMFMDECGLLMDDSLHMHGD